MQQKGLVKWISLVVLSSLLALGPAKPARADMAPPPPPSGSSIGPGGEVTQVRMMAETVIIDVAQNRYVQSAPSGVPMNEMRESQYQEVSSAHVKATFQMRNLGSQEERMDARFPLNSLYPQYQDGPNTCVAPMVAPEISDFTVSVDGRPVKVTNTVQRLTDSAHGGVEKDVKCWANFPVVFPVQKDVTVEVNYTVEAYYAYYVGGIVEFPYVLQTGAAWKDSIGSVDIIFRAPFELTAQTLVDYSPSEDPAVVKVAGKEISWHFENYEPQRNINATIINPGLWQRIQQEKDILAKNPSDGEAWGRLGRWYKEAIKMGRGFLWSEGGREMYDLSRAAYEKAVTLKPQDADWHAFYGDLACWNVEFQQFGTKVQLRDDLVKCLDQTRQALAINPSQARALELLDEMKQWDKFGTISEPRIIADGNRPVYLALTTTPTAEPEDTATPTETSTLIPATPAERVLPTLPEAAAPTRAASATPIAQAVQPTAAAPLPSRMEATPVVNGSKAARGLCGAILLPGLALVAVWWLKRRSG